jgi:arylsulfatase A-like enzyme/Tfp pilus assembly protein PilF
MTRSVRYALILVLFGLGTGLAAVAGWRYARASSPVSGPIILISIDSLRADRLGAYGGRRVPTPALDRLAADGIVFERAYSHSPQTLPAHAALLSGRLPFETGVNDEVDVTFPPTARLLPEMLSARGYATGGIVSSFALRRATGLARGFALFDDEIPDQSGSGGPAVHRDGAESERRAERWLSAIGTSRAFLFLHLDEPRAPYAPPERFSSYAPYDGEVAYADEIVGRLVAYLEKQQLYGQSTIIVVADHGESLGAHGEQEHGVLVHDATTHVPFIVKLPTAEQAGRRVPHVAQHVDLVPTILDLARAPIPRGLPGRSLVPLLDGDPPGDRLAYAESRFAARQFGLSPIASLTDGRFRYVRTGGEALYDLDADPEATVNLIDVQPAVAARFRAALDELIDRPRRPSPAAPSPPVVEDAVHRDRLWRLGFVGPRRAGLGTPVAQDVDPAGRLAFIEGYRRAFAEAGSHRWGQALERLHAIAIGEPDQLDAWASLAQLAERAGRYDLASDAYRHVLLRAADLVGARLGLASVLLKSRRLEEAHRQAELASQSTGAGREVRGLAHELLARIALERHDPGSARVQAQRILEFDPRSPVPALVEGRLLFERERYEEALEYLNEAAERVTGSAAGTADVHYLRARTLLKLGRQAEAEAALLAEISGSPESTKARAALAALYHELGRPDEAAAAVADLTRLVATPDAFNAAARLWTALGDRERAAGVRAEGRRTPAPTPSDHVSVQ